MSRGQLPAVQHMVGNEDRCSGAAVKHINEVCRNQMKGATASEGPARFQVAAVRRCVPEVSAISEKKDSQQYMSFYGFSVIVLRRHCH